MENQLGAYKIKKGLKTWNSNFPGNTMENLLIIFCSHYDVEFRIATCNNWKEAKYIFSPGEKDFSMLMMGTY